MTSRDLTIKDNEQYMLTPAEVVQNSTTQAKLLMDIVEQTKCYQQIRDKKYLQVEAWETIGAFNRTHAETESITPIMQDGETIGYLAKVQLFKDGFVIGGAIMPCYFTENACRGKEGDAKHKASMSAAQTFATSKAYRMNFSYVAILAGYSATPAEEMTGEDSTTPDHTQHSHYCTIHKTAFFKKGKMPGYAHPIGDTGEWCNEPEPPKNPIPAVVDTRGELEKEGRDLLDEATEQVLHPATADEKAEPPVEEAPPAEEQIEAVSPIDLNWLQEQLVILKEKKITGWTNAGIAGKLQAITGQSATTVREAVSYLTKEQAEKFVAMISETVGMA